MPLVASITFLTIWTVKTYVLEKKYIFAPKQNTVVLLTHVDIQGYPYISSIEKQSFFLTRRLFSGSAAFSCQQL